MAFLPELPLIYKNILIIANGNYLITKINTPDYDFQYQ